MTDTHSPPPQPPGSDSDSAAAPTQQAEQEPRREWFPIGHKMWGPLDDSFPAPVLDGTWADRGVSTWRRGWGGWDGYWPPEDSALAPCFDWTDRHKELLLEAYNRKWSKYLEPGEEYRLTWPPEGNLATEGWATEGEPGWCSKHERDYNDGCEECEFAREESPSDSIEPAEWEWYVTVETYEPAGETSMALANTERLHFMSTEMDPRGVEYQ
jgi:hypothetical protein